jgi:hypothetical protein
MENQIISITLTLFMLSLITEKIANFIKLHVRSLAEKAGSALGEKKRERKMQLLTGVIGIAVALVCNADFFMLISENSKIEPLTLLTFKGVVGCVITGLFLSQGSKFFHDLLNTVLYFKNMRKAIYNKQQIENDLLEKGNNLTADSLLTAVTADQRQDEEDVNQ